MQVKYSLDNKFAFEFKYKDLNYYIDHKFIHTKVSLTVLPIKNRKNNICFKYFFISLIYSAAAVSWGQFGIYFYYKKGICITV